MPQRLLAAMAAVILSVPPAAAPVAAQSAEPEVREYQVPWTSSRPRDPYVAPVGRVWFVGQSGNYLAVFDPASGAMERVEIEPGTHPHNQIVDPQGRVWYAGNRNGIIGRYDPDTRKFARYPMPDSAVRDPHTLVFDGRGHIFFTAQGAGHVGRLNMESGKIDLIPVGPRTRPYGIVVDGQAQPWFTLFGTNKLAMIDPATLALKEYQLPEGSRPRRIAVGGDGRTIWYVDYSRGFLGRLDPSSGEVKEFASPGGASARPYAMTSDDQGRLWYVETGLRPNRMVAFDPVREEFVVNQPVGVEGPNAIRHMVYDPATRTIWYGADANVLGRVSVPVTLGAVP
jgi:virginiamycin B lyase